MWIERNKIIPKSFTHTNTKLQVSSKEYDYKDAKKLWEYLTKIESPYYKKVKSIDITLLQDFSVAQDKIVTIITRQSIHVFNISITFISILRLRFPKN